MPPQTRFFFQQLISGVSYCHSMVCYLSFKFSFMSLLSCVVYEFFFQEICHRDLKLENTLLDGSPAPRLKICDFGYSKVNVSWLFKFFFYDEVLKVFPTDFFFCNCSLLYCTHNPNQQLEHQHILPQKSCHAKNTMARYLVFYIFHQT